MSCGLSFDLKDFDKGPGEVKRMYLFAGVVVVVETRRTEGLRMRKVISRTTIGFMEGWD